MGSVFVLDAYGKPALVSMRNLDAHNLDVTAGSTTQWSGARLSRHVDKYVTYPAPTVDPDGFVDAIERELASREYDMLLPIREETVDVVVRHRSRFDQYTNVPFPPYEKLLVGLDKRRTVEAVRETEVPHPTTLFSDEISLDDVDAVLGYPIVVKHPRGASHDGVAICESFDELERMTREYTETCDTVLFQEFIPNGGECGVYTLYDCDGNCVGRTVQRRLRSRPPEGGASTYRETIEDPQLVTLADEFLTAIDWQGLAMVEFRIDARTGEPNLIEMNPRLWGSLSLSTYAGVDFPYLLYQLALGETPDPVLDYDVGVRSRCLFTDALQVFEREDRLTALREFFTPSPRPCTHDIVSRNDPLATVGHFAYYTTIAYDLLTGGSDEAGHDSEPSIE